MIFPVYKESKTPVNHLIRSVCAFPHLQAKFKKMSYFHENEPIVTSRGQKECFYFSDRYFQFHPPFL